MSAAQGILTSTGGMTSHAAVVGRQMGKPAVVGCGAAKVHEEKKQIHRRQADRQGRRLDVHRRFDRVKSVSADQNPAFRNHPGRPRREKIRDVPDVSGFHKLLSWADKVRRLKVRANADTPEETRTAFAFGAQGIGLARTEHMFFGPTACPSCGR
jgi:pyruvate, orthophosphate dikinase